MVALKRRKIFTSKIRSYGWPSEAARLHRGKNHVVDLDDGTTIPSSFDIPVLSYQKDTQGQYR